MLQHTLGNYSSLQELLEQELVYVAEQIQRAPDNESSWNYLWGLFALPGCPQHEMGRQDKVRKELQGPCASGWRTFCLRCRAVHASHGAFSCPQLCYRTDVRLDGSCRKMQHTASHHGLHIMASGVMLRQQCPAHSSSKKVTCLPCVMPCTGLHHLQGGIVRQPILQASS